MYSKLLSKLKLGKLILRNHLGWKENKLSAAEKNTNLNFIVENIEREREMLPQDSKYFVSFPKKCQNF